MRVVEARGDLAEDVRGDGDRTAQLALVRLHDCGAQVAALDQLHREEQLAVGFAEVEHLDDVSVGELDSDARFVDEAADEPALARRGRQDALERLHLLEARDADGLDLVDLGHTALRDLLEYVVLPETLAQRFHCRRGYHGSWPTTPSLEGVLGYTFRDGGLLERALRHASWCNEQHGSDHPEDNERLEFLGDAVLALVVGDRLMTRYPQLREGELSMTRAQVVSEAGLSDIATTLGIGRWLMLGKGEEKSGGRAKPSILADAFEAIAAAVYLDGGFEAAQAMVNRAARAAHRDRRVQGLLRLQDAAARNLAGAAQGDADVSRRAASSGPITTSASSSR